MALVSKNFSDIVTFSRASGATYFDSTGTLQTAATNAPRLDFDPSTLAARGLLIEEQRTNSIRNNTMVGAVAGSPGTLPTNWSVFTTLTGLTRQIVGTGTDAGMTYIDIRLSGTPSAAGSYFLQFDTNTAIAASNAQVWTSSAFCKLVAGSLTGLTDLRLNTSIRDSAGNALSGGFTSVTPTSTLQRFTNTYTNNSASTNYELTYFEFILSGAAIDFTVRIGMPQLEQGAFATSVIATSGAAATRAADVATINALSPWFNAAGGTIYLEAYGAGGSTTAQAIVLTDGTTEIESIRNFSNSARFVAQSVASASAGAISNASIYKAAYAFASGDQAMSVNGAAPLTGTTAITSTPTLMRLGTNMGGNGGFLNSWIRKITYYPSRLTNAQLQSLTT